MALVPLVLQRAVAAGDDFQVRLLSRYDALRLRAEVVDAEDERRLAVDEDEDVVELIGDVVARCLDGDDVRAGRRVGPDGDAHRARLGALDVGRAREELHGRVGGQSAGGVGRGLIALRRQKLRDVDVGALDVGEEDLGRIDDEVLAPRPGRAAALVDDVDDDVGEVAGVSLGLLEKAARGRGDVLHDPDDLRLRLVAGRDVDDGHVDAGRRGLRREVVRGHVVDALDVLAGERLRQRVGDQDDDLRRRRAPAAGEGVELRTEDAGARRQRVYDGVDGLVVWDAAAAAGHDELGRRGVEGVAVGREVLDDVDVVVGHADKGKLEVAARGDLDCVGDLLDLRLDLLDDVGHRAGFVDDERDVHRSALLRVRRGRENDPKEHRRHHPESTCAQRSHLHPPSSAVEVR